MDHISEIIPLKSNRLRYSRRIMPLLLAAAVGICSCLQPAQAPVPAEQQTEKIPEPVPQQNIMSVAQVETDNSVEAELASFKVADGYKVELYASESLGIANPVAMRWDERGRLWVLCTTTYPQPEPGKKPNDKLFILEDTNNDGIADTSSVFADSLVIPLGFELGHGGVYMGQQTELIFLEDTDNNDKADRRSVIFSGFGTGDLHQTINSFTWSPGGDLFFSQGHNIYSRIETPWGIKRQNRAGIWRYRPTTGKLDNFFDWSTASVNPWGMNFDDWGNMFHKANDPPLYYSVPGLIEDSKRSYLPEIGSLEIKGSGLAIVRTAHLPNNLQGDFIMAGYYNNRVERMKVSDDGSGFKARLVEPLVISASRSFRPVEVHIGPDGAIYVLDWYDPIIGHYQASLRHPDRDKLRGRIWRITAKDSPLVKRPELAGRPAAEWLDHLKSPEFWVRYQVKRLLAAAPGDTVVAAVNVWIQKLDPKDRAYEHHLVEAAGVLESHDAVNENVVTRLMKAKQPGARAYAAQVISRWHDRMADPLQALRLLVNDNNPRVRLHALVALSYIHDAQSIAVAAEMFDHPTDQFLLYAWDKTVYTLRPVWEKALQQGNIRFSKPAHLAHVIAGDPPDWFPAHRLTELIGMNDVPASEKTGLLLALAQADSGAHVNDVIRRGAALKDAELLNRLAALPPQPLSDEAAGHLTAVLDGANAAPLKLAAIALLKRWQIRQAGTTVGELVQNKSQAVEVRAAAIQALAQLEGERAVPLLKTQVGSANSAREIKLAALKSLGVLDLSLAAGLTVDEVERSKTVEEMLEIISPVAEQQGGIELITGRIKEQPVSASAAGLLLEALAHKGIEAPDLRSQLNTIAGKTATVPAAYDGDYISQLIKIVKEKGDAARGSQVYQRLSSCASCHTIHGKGGNIGPNLSALGRGLSPEEIAIEVLWPSQNIKEGYSRVTATTAGGEIIQGIRLAEDAEDIRIRTATDGNVSVSKKGLKHIEEAGSLMPAGLLDGTGREDIADLIKYLSMLGREEQ
ncbi:PVC-type heme-binding CxxCH protein [Agriterribacter sp.]|uniref:PVC-type heme-binding CxxCH protein n=1 Tax=Agriterribacter sp. TaxID=2821509 RepID=UPI002C267D5E|nr:PVC-type heme-binding CxxCH protein [Agriterribacter sp.]HRP57713.1 HEAT repeat domain-containing protein [Agriterribacter sp.]